ncbi:histidinol-phosphate transaminase [Bacillus sp. 2205SS5-2]|uniref:histidinol-phosphate transaminase n=1 Tax=Bacillus sp. 2205SS5-2 TaxID=3109031 RepID=UPI0030071ADA
MKWKTGVSNIKAYKPGKSVEEVKRELGLSKITKMASNENPYGTSSLVDKFLKETQLAAQVYPDGFSTSLRKELASRLQISENQLIFGNGSDEVIQMIARALLHPEVNTVMPSPSFPQYKHNAMIEGAEIREVALVDGAHDLDEMLRQINSETAVVWLCSPNNPTGLYINHEELTRFMEGVRDDVLVVLDEAYYEYVTADDYHDSMDFIKRFPNLLVTRTFSKIYGLASFRVGYGIASSEIISKLDPLREPFNNNTLGQGAATVALQDQSFIETCRQKNIEGIELYEEFCKEHGLYCYPSQGNFVLIDLKMNGDKVFQYLLREGYIVRSGTALGYPTCIRVTVGRKETNIKVITSLRKFLKQIADS